MSKQIIKLVAIIMIATVALKAFSLAHLARAADVAVSLEANSETTSTGTQMEAETRRQMEADILAATVRFEMKSWIVYVEGVGHTNLEANGHGTIQDGRYLLTHNHMDEYIVALLADGDSRKLITTTLYRPDGEPLIELAPGSITVAAIDTETVVLDFGLQEGVGFFAALGLSSAQVIPMDSITLAAGTEVAQIDWDGQTTRVEWVAVETVKTVSGTPIVQLDDSVLKGASGGGVFWQGFHIGNNWSTNAASVHESGPNVDHYSHVALNSDLVTNLGSQKLFVSKSPTAAGK